MSFELKPLEQTCRVKAAKTIAQGNNSKLKTKNSKLLSAQGSNSKLKT
jgi:hypothetical protein